MKRFVHYRSRRVVWLGAGVGICLLVGIVVIMIHHRKPVSPGLSATTATANLVQTTTNMRESFGNPVTNTGKVARQYLQYMRQLQAECTQLNKSMQAAKLAVASTDTIVLLNNSVSLCKDLSSLAKSSAATYTATLPLLTSSTKVKRFQTLGVIKNGIKSGNQSDVRSAITALSKDSTGADGSDSYPSFALGGLKKLQTTIDHSPGLSYLPALQTFQAQLLAERHQYWTGYGDMSGLIRTLKAQLTAYCGNLGPNTDEPAVCRSSAKN